MQCGILNQEKHINGKTSEMKSPVDEELAFEEGIYVYVVCDGDGKGQ